MRAESIRIRSETIAIYRAWAENTGRSVVGLIELVLMQAAQHYLDGLNPTLHESNKQR